MSAASLNRPLEYPEFALTDIVEIYTDGACRGNPGPGGWGVVLIAGPHRKTLYGGEAETTNNRMELLAAIAGYTVFAYRVFWGKTRELSYE